MLTAALLIASGPVHHNYRRQNSTCLYKVAQQPAVAGAYARDVLILYMLHTQSHHPDK